MRWPHAFRQIAELVGDDSALQLCRNHGGVELYVPKDLAADHRLVAEIGAEAAEKLSREYGGCKIHPPLMKDAVKLDIAEAEGSLTEIARRFRVTRTWVQRVKSMCGSDAAERKKT